MHVPRRSWNKLTSPSSAITALDERRQAQFIASMMLGFLLVGSMVALVSLIMFAPPDQRMSLLSGSAMTAALVLGLYLLSRTRWYRAAVILSGLLFVLLVLLTVLSDLNSSTQPLDENSMIYLVLPVLLASVLGSTRTTVLVAVFCTLCAFVVFLVTPISFINVIVGPLTFLLVVSTLLVISARQRDLLEADRRAAVEESEARFRTLLEATYEGVVIARHDRVVAANSGFCDVFGYAPDAVVGLPLTRFIPMVVAGSDGVAWPIDQLAEGRGLRQDGSRIDVEFMTKEQVYEREPALVVAVRDITERKLMAQAMQRAQRLDSLGVLAGGIAHDFNNLLTGIITQSTLASLHLDETDAARQYVDQSLASAEQAAGLTQQLLAYVGKGVAQRQTFEFNRLVNQTVPVLKTSIPPNIDLIVDLSDEQCFIVGDTSQIQQVLVNLVINAAQAIDDERGIIRVQTRQVNYERQKRFGRYIGREQLEPGSLVEIRVIDNGPGMPDAVRQRIFEPFYSTKAAREGVGGHGLGLSTTLGVVRAHSGAIDVRSRLGEGTEFSVVLPLVAAPVDTAVKPLVRDSAEMEREASPLVLVVDDESSVRDAVCDVFDLHNIRALTAEDGVEAVEQFAVHLDDIDTVILDMRMPNKNGEQTLTEIRALAPHAKVILTSGYAETDVLDKYTDDHNITFLTKPFDVERLMDAVSTTLGRALS